MFEKENSVFKNMMYFLFVLIGVFCFTYFSLKKEVLSNDLVFAIILCIYFLFEILFSREENHRKRLISRLICVCLLVFWICSFFISMYLFRNHEFFSSVVGYVSIETGATNSALVSKNNSGRYLEQRVHTYLIKEGKEKEEIPKIWNQYFGEDFIIKINDYTQSDTFQEGNAFRGEDVVGSFFIYKKGNYTILRIE